MCVICYGLVIGGISLAAFLKVPYDRIVMEGLPVNLHNILEGLNISVVLARAQTHAFMVLGISQLFHAIAGRKPFDIPDGSQRKPADAACFCSRDCPAGGSDRDSFADYTFRHGTVKYGGVDTSDSAFCHAASGA